MRLLRSGRALVASLSSSTSTFLVPVIALMLTGCSSGEDKKTTPGEQRAAAAVTGLKETRAEIMAGRGQIERTLATMNGLRDGQGSLQTEFAAFNADLKKVDEHAAKIRARAASMRANSAQYQTKWRDEMSKVEDPALRAAASERANKVRERFDIITEKSSDARGAYEPFIKQLKNVQTYLSNDLTPQGIQSASAVFDKATADGKVVLEKIDAVVAELDGVASSLSPSAGAGPTAPTKK